MLCWAGLAHIDATVRALVEIINAFCLCDSQCVTMATKHLVHLLLSPVCQFDKITANMRKKERKNVLWLPLCDCRKQFYFNVSVWFALDSHETHFFCFSCKKMVVKWVAVFLCPGYLPSAKNVLAVIGTHPFIDKNEIHPVSVSSAGLN